MNAKVGKLAGILPVPAWRQALLHHRGFTLRGVYHMAYDAQGWPIQADFLFARVAPETVKWTS